MAVKIFCNSCLEFIRDAKRAEISELTGEEICQTCEGKVSEFLIEVEKKAKQSSLRIQRELDEFKVGVDEARRRIIRREDDGTNI